MSKHHLLSQRENYILGYSIVSGNISSSVALHQNHAIISIYRNASISFILNLKMPKIKWGGAEDPTINNLYKIDNRKL